MHIGDNLRIVAVGIIVPLEELTAGYVVVGNKIIIMVVIRALIKVLAVSGDVGVLVALAIVLGVSGALQE